ncbi:hypothetical protein [Phytoactinopolyspora limicola]|uniref:hypothetical protein n=1 Tax=Phytoactinopolyspora limicola TaxID=2715536 RepID=UPI00140C2D6B|nr:hypothetical protein [Phytoactinopolyspora limicola]
MNRGRASSKPEGESSQALNAKTQLTSAWIGLVGVAIGAILGLSGSLLLYFQGNNIHDVAAQNRVADIRRAAYSDFVAQTQSVRGTFTTFHNQVVNGAKGQELFTLYNEIIAPELVKYARVASSIELVAPPSVGDASRKVSLVRDRFSELAFRSIESKDGESGPVVPYSQDEFESILDDFDRAVRDFTNEARASSV